jgi:magnesium transporter
MTEQTEEDRQQALVSAVRELIATERSERITALLDQQYPADVARMLEALPSDWREGVWALIDPTMHAEVLAEVEDSVRSGHLEVMAPRELALVAQDVDLDDAVDIIQDLPVDKVDDVLEAMDAQHRARLEQVLAYDEDTAGGLMNTDVLTIRSDVSMETVSRFLRRRGEIPEKTNRLMVVDRDNRLVGQLRLALLILEAPESMVSEHMEVEFPGIVASASSQEVARLFQQRDLISAPVVDEEGHLIGRITVDDVMDVVRDEGERSLMQSAGLNEEDDAFEPALASVKRRTPWLGVNLATALLASWMIGLFEATLQQVVALAILMPVVASMGGIAGSQTLTIVIRGIALGRVGTGNSRLLLFKEALVGVVNGLIWALVVAAVAMVWFSDWRLGAVAAGAVLVNLVVAAAAGALIPLLLKRLHVDPALAGGVVLTTVTDVVGFVAFLGLGTLVLLG